MNIEKQSYQNSALHVQQSIQQAKEYSFPYTHWMLEDVIPSYICDSLLEWMPDEKAISGDIQGRRENNNQNRVFVNPLKQEQDKRCAALAYAFNVQETRDLFSKMTGTDLSNTWLRLELCLDKDGFWLEPHTDIGAKKLTFLVSLSVGDEATSWGTDIMNAQGDSLARSSGKFNSALLFIPGKDTWHGFKKRPINGIRRTLIINYVDSSWHAKHELAFPT
ncbi:2OG-Fe(II) oxygenase [Commensalibacter oyaizuii]|uniref:2OG-Fe(II) oxygenase n=1 Tax=Commensalibacter oyaizuii TaxID=3043873 RepID=A0ABT6Q255_9PROT|nr:2OG-Fe(II) oxygenase [Commensalibacter sp. TBRC 16381]MDI2091185.1 2OG-Fe(II) oxygenase [Commensalibacter sp. TBRC 16381]